jgi:hypothetical protein
VKTAVKVNVSLILAKYAPRPGHSPPRYGAVARHARRDALAVDSHDGRYPWVNILHAPDGRWGIGGRAYSDADLLAEDPAALRGGR